MSAIPTRSAFGLPPAYRQADAATKASGRFPASDSMNSNDDAMNRSARFGTKSRRMSAVRACGLALLALACSAQAQQTSAPFNVVVNPLPGAATPGTEHCTMVGAFGKAVTITCTPGAVRFITQPPPEDELDTEDANAGAGSVTSWRRIRLDNGDELLEMTVRW